MSTTKQRIVIVGGGGAGSAVAKGLAQQLPRGQQHTLTLISDRDFRVHLPGTLRLSVSPTEGLDTLIPYDKLFAKTPADVASFKRGVVTDVTRDDQATDGGARGHVVLASGERVPWDILVLATGSKWTGLPNVPVGDQQEVVGFAEAWREKFKKSRHVAIVGGGSVGCETAGEIKDLYPDTKVTLVHNGPLPLNDTYPESMRRKIAVKLKSIGVELVLDDAVEAFPEQGGEVDGVSTRKGVQIPADLVVPSMGPQPNTDMLGSLGPDVLNERKQVKVLPTFQLPSSPYIFAAGDITDWKEQKQLMKVNAHAGVIVPNIVSLLNGGKATVNYKGFPEMITVIIGRKLGVMYAPFLGGMTMGNFMSSTLKGKKLLIPMVRGGMGY